ncbi:MAG: OmpA family protein [Saprospiraceae bacterium]|nr:OmpA family protein [Saprospiraceae bacterium]
MRLIFTIAFIAPLFLLAQPKTTWSESSQENLVPNPSFEEFDGFPIGWYYKGTDFDDVVKYWTSPTTASPDVYGSRVRVPSSWAEKGFGKQTPHTGQSMAGITVYGCSNGKPHCREYVQIQLKEPLVEGQNYVFEIWMASLEGGLRCNNLGVFVTKKQMKIAGEERINVKPLAFAAKIIEPKPKGWQKLTLKFKADSEAEWLIIGNFNDDETTMIMAAPSVSNLNFGYYYLDDVSLKKTEPILPVPIKDDDLTRVNLEVGKVVRLKDIYFDSNKSDLLPRSSVELDKLVVILKENPTLEIEIIGHTDNVGDSNHNLILSRRRAAMVMDYLIRGGIVANRLKSNGFGDKQPIASNDSEETRQMNRRVEFRILKK